jgi:hypothetical protein
MYVCMYFTTTSRPTLGPTQPHIERVMGALFPGVKRPVRETDHSPLSSTEVKECVELHLHSPTRLHGVVISKSQGKFYLLPLLCMYVCMYFRYREE